MYVVQYQSALPQILSFNLTVFEVALKLYRTVDSKFCSTDN